MNGPQWDCLNSFFFCKFEYLTNKIGNLNNRLPDVSHLPQRAKNQLLKKRGVFEVKKIEIHEEYVPGHFLNDVAIMTLKKHFKFNRKTKKGKKIKKGKLQTKNYLTKGKVQSHLVTSGLKGSLGSKSNKSNQFQKCNP